MINRLPEPGPEVAAYLAENPVIKELTVRYCGYAYPNARQWLPQEKFTPKLARELVLAMFSTDADSLELHGVENWADFHCYLLRQWRFHTGYWGNGMEEEFDGYSSAKHRDWEAEERKRKYGRKRKS